MDGQADKEITLYINSPGGDCESGLALYDAIRMTSPTHFSAVLPAAKKPR